MLSYDSTTFIVAISALSAAILASHATASFGGGWVRRVAFAIGVLLHLAALGLFLFTVGPEGRAIELEVIVLYFTLSTLVYASLFFIADRLASRATRNKREEGEA